MLASFFKKFYLVLVNAIFSAVYKVEDTAMYAFCHYKIIDRREVPRLFYLLDWEDANAGKTGQIVDLSDLEKNGNAYLIEYVSQKEMLDEVKDELDVDEIRKMSDEDLIEMLDELSFRHP